MELLPITSRSGNRPDARRLPGEAGTGTLYLLAEEAADCFRSLGFEDVDRAGAPPEIAATRQFASLCRGDAAFMREQP